MPARLFARCVCAARTLRPPCATALPIGTVTEYTVKNISLSSYLSLLCPLPLPIISRLCVCAGACAGAQVFRELGHYNKTSTATTVDRQNEKGSEKHYLIIAEITKQIYLKREPLYSGWSLASFTEKASVKQEQEVQQGIRQAMSEWSSSRVSSPYPRCILVSQL